MKYDGHMKQMELRIVVKREGGHAVASAHYSNTGMDLLDETFPRLWIGRSR
jgi:hypothetical protein